MPNPLRIEEQFQTLKQSVALLSSPRMRLLKISGFLDSVSDGIDRSVLTAYAPEIVPQFCSLVLHTDFVGTNIAALGKLQSTLRKISEAVAKYNTDARIKEAISHLSSEQAKIAEWMQLNGHNPASPPERSSRRSPLGLRASPGERHPGGVWIPLVEHEPLLTGVSPLFASLRRLRLEVNFSSKGGEEDEVHIQRLLETEASDTEKLHAALAAGKTLLRERSDIVTTRRLVVHCSLGDTGVVAGESLNAGLAALLFVELLRLYQCKDEFSFRDSVAITGGVDADGNLLPVDEDGLRLKVEACVFSPVKYLVVAKDQVELCRAALLPLQAAANNPSSLQIIGVSALREIFYDRRLTDLHNVPLLKQTARKVLKWRRPIAAILFVALLLVISKLLYGPIDRNPVIADFEGEMMEVKNRYGETISEIRVGKGTVGIARTQKQAGMASQLYSFYDTDHDGLNEVFLVQEDLEQDKSAMVLCKSIVKDSLLWSKPFTRKLDLPRDPGAAQEQFHAFTLQVGDFDRDGKAELLVIGTNGFYPCLLWKLDAATGKEIGVYLHMGNFNSMQMVDLDGDGRQEILLTGVNNAFRRACVVVLDPRFVYGHSPLWGDYFVKGIPEGVERTYVLIPRTKIGEAFKYDAKWSSAYSPDISRASSTFRIAVDDIYPQNANLFRGTIQLTFDFTLKVISVGTGDEFDLLVEKAFDEKRISKKPDFEYWEEYKKTMMYWDGEGWQNKPVMNQRYVEALRKMKATTSTKE